MRKTITVLLLAVFAAALLITTASATKPAPKPTTKTAPAKKTTAKATKPAVKPLSKTEKGMATGMGKAGKFVTRTFTVPQKNPKAKHKPTNRKQSNLLKGVHHSAHKAGKWLKGATKLK